MVDLKGLIKDVGQREKASTEELKQRLWTVTTQNEDCNEISHLLDELKRSIQSYSSAILPSHVSRSRFLAIPTTPPCSLL